MMICNIYSQGLGLYYVRRILSQRDACNTNSRVSPALLLLVMEVHKVQAESIDEHWYLVQKLPSPPTAVESKVNGCPT